MKKQIMITILLLAAILVSVSAVSAANLTVGTGGTYSNIQDAYDAAADDGDTIIIANGTYTGTSNRGITISKNINITGQSQTGTIIDAQGASYIFSIGEGYTVTISHLTLQNGNTTSNGGAIKNNGNLTVNKCTFKDNNADDSGGAIYSEDGKITITGCTFTGNTADYGGGAIYNNNESATITGCTFTGNTADHGGAISIYGGNTTITGCTFTGNTAVSEAGAIYIKTAMNYDETYYASDCTITDCTFTNNNAGSEAGAIYNEQNLTLRNSMFNSNTGTEGGAIHDESGSYNSRTFITNCIFKNNNATEDGGAIYNCCGDETITGCTFVGNTATDEGGAIYNWMYLTAHFNRIVGNTANYGSAIYNEKGYTANLENNWWGSNIDPKSITNLIAGNANGVDADPWLILSIRADPAEVFNTKTSNVIVDLFTDSDGFDHSSDSTKYPSEIPVTFTATWGSITQAVLNYGIGTAIFTANGGPVPEQNPVIVSVADILNQTATVSTNITIMPTADLYIKTTTNNGNPKVGEKATITYKLGNNGPDEATNVTVTILLPVGFEMGNISGDGKWIYHPATRKITWTITNVPVGDPYLYVEGRFLNTGSYLFDSFITARIYDLNTEGITPLTVNVVPVVNSANSVTKTTTVRMQETGVPLAGLILAILAVFGGLLAPKRK